MTYNIRLDTPVDSVNQWPNRKQKVFALIKKYSPDVVGVQEALHHQLMDLVQNLPEYDYIGVARDDGKTKGEYSAILYRKNRLTLISQKTFWLSETPDVPGSKSWDAAITRVVTSGNFTDKLNKKKILLVNTHFDHLGRIARAKSAMLIKTKIKEQSKDLPVIVMGDFNSEKTEEAYGAMINNNDVHQIKVEDARPTSDTRGTFCSFKVNSMPCKGIDYIFSTPQWRKENYWVIDDNDGTYYPSDHLPVMSEFSLIK
jgi:endonuclease/exonuclease/phosphatase family metal-dependent hydrolase